MAPRFTDSPNARSKSISTADLDTNGVLNRHSANHPTFRVGVSEDKGTRRTMEDAHSFVVDFDAVRGQGFFAVFDGHAGKHAAEWCGSHFHEYLLDAIHSSPDVPIPDILNHTFHAVDESLSRMCEESEGKIHSGCTAVTAFLRVEDSNGRQSFLSPPSSPSAESPVSGHSINNSVDGEPGSFVVEDAADALKQDATPKKAKEKKTSSTSRLRKALRSLGGGASSKFTSSSASGNSSSAASVKSVAEGVTITVPPPDAKYVLYSANAGDARGVLCRAGKAVRLTYDHKGTDKQEAKRITDAGGFVMSGRVNGVLAVTRSLGDSSMKEFVVGAPYTTETELCEEDELLILACDGLWDVIGDQAAIDLVRDIEDAQQASSVLCQHALSHHTTDNVTVVVVRFKHLGPQRDFEEQNIRLVPMYGQQPYPGPTPAYGSEGPYYVPPEQPLYGGDIKDPYAGGRFKPKKRVNDPIFLIFFVLQFLGFAAVSGVALNTWISQDGLGGGLGKGGGQTGTVVTMNRSTVYLLLLVTAAGMLLSVAYLMLARMFTKTIMHITLILTIALNIGICVYYYITKYWSGAIIFTIIAILSVLSYFGFRSRIPLASLLLQVVMDVSKHHTSVYAVAFASLFLQAVLSVWFTFTTIATYAKWTPGNPSCDTSSCSSGKVAGLIFFEAFSFLWTSQVIGNVALSTLAGGPYGSWYYFGPRGNGEMPNHPTLSAFGRASTLSLGSIAFGSLIVTILDLLRLILNAAQQNANADGHPVEACLACCAACFVGMLQSLVEYFNRYAYIEIALYGKPYIKAAKDTWRLFKDRGIDALVNDSLVGMTLTWGAYAIGVLCSLFGYLYLRFTAPSYNSEGQYTAPIVLFSFLIGMVCSMTMGSAIEAGVSTIFVGLGEDPQVLAIRAPELFSMIAQAYPDVTRGVPRG
ncbi:Protein PNS1 [Psilocybe cubensis]|uniref:Protein PNS1 n=2 Tax=Psilocybe cubensis TaxID=181762 RepID=A0ACB8HC13_PSICU|nr:Protein PNS1 [Psilocybe cubensis]KAH9485401.1 Protein PNS1 [Psilocybe cubensis]